MIISEHRFRPFLPQSIVLYIPHHIIKNITSNLVALNFQKPCSQRYFCLDFKYRNAFNTFQISLKCKNINYYFNKYHTRYKQYQHVYHCCKTWVMATQPTSMRLYKHSEQLKFYSKTLIPILRCWMKFKTKHNNLWLPIHTICRH